MELIEAIELGRTDIIKLEYKRTCRQLHALAHRHRRGELSDEDYKELQLVIAIKLGVVWGDMKAFTELCERKRSALGHKFQESEFVKQLGVVSTLAIAKSPQPDIPDWELVEQLARLHLSHMKISI